MRSTASRSHSLLEHLESRVLLATVTWDGGAGTTSWHDAMNWDGDALPGASDDVIIDVMDETITVTHSMNVATTVNSITNEENIVLSDGTISTAAAWTQSGDMDMTGGEVAGAGDLLLGGGFDWTGGTMSGSGRTFVTLGEVAQIDGSVGLERLLSNFGTLLWTSGDITMNGGTLNNKGTFFTSAAAVAMDGGGANVVANNAVMIRQNVGVDTQTEFDVPFQNNGQLTVGSGSLRFNDTFVSFSGSLGLNSATSRIKFFGPTSSIKTGTSVFGSGAIAYQAGVNTIDGTFSSVGEVTVVDSKLFANTAASIQNLDIDDGVVNAASAITIQNRFRHFGGTIKSSGSLIIQAAATMVMNNSGPMFLGLDVTNNGAATLQTGIWRPFNMTFTNNGTLTLQAGSIRTATGSAEFDNNGTINKTTAGVVDIFSGQGPTSLTNDGDINVTQGTLKIFGGGANNDTITVDGGVLQFGQVTYFQDGMITGSGLVSIFAKVNWLSGTIDVNDFKVNTGVILALIGSDPKTLGSNLNILGAVNWNDGPLSMTSADVTIRDGATFTLADDVAPTVASSTIQTLAGGTLRKTGGLVLDFADDVTLTNAGTVSVEGGTLSFDAAQVTNITGSTLTGGTWRVQNNGKLNTGVSGDITALAATVNISGQNSTYSSLNAIESNTGSIIVSNMATFVAALGAATLFTNSGTIDLNNGTFQVDGNFLANAQATTIIRVDANGNVGQIQAVGATASLNGALQVIFNGYTPKSTVMHTFVSASTRIGAFTDVSFSGTPAGFTPSINYTSTIAQIVLTEN